MRQFSIAKFRGEGLSYCDEMLRFGPSNVFLKFIQIDVKQALTIPGFTRCLTRAYTPDILGPASAYRLANPPDLTVQNAALCLDVQASVPVVFRASA